MFGHVDVEVTEEATADLARALERALATDELAMAYQPIVDIPSRTVVGTEALCRWDSPTLGPVLPSSFIAAAEDHGVIHQLGSWVMRRAMTEHLQMQERLGRPLRLAVNVSPRQIDGPRFIHDVADALDSTGFDPRVLELEITERTLIDDTRLAAESMAAIRRLGVSVSLDDFGTGFANLGILGQITFDIIKVDRSFIGRLPASPVDRAIATTIIDLAHRIDARVVAEGVEDASQLAWLRSQGCDEAQGYLFSPAVPARDVTPALLARLAAS